MIAFLYLERNMTLNMKVINTKTKEFTYKEIKEAIKYPIVIDEHTFITAKKYYIKV